MSEGSKVLSSAVSLQEDSGFKLPCQLGPSCAEFIGTFHVLVSVLPLQQTDDLPKV